MPNGQPQAIYKKLCSEPLALADLAQIQPSLARGLQQLLDYDGGDVEEVFCRSFVGTYEAWGEVVEEDLIEGGNDVAVTEANRKGTSTGTLSSVHWLTRSLTEYVRLLVEFLLSRSVEPQFAAFAEGFSEVCAGNALSLFKADELELVVRGSTEPLDIDALRGVTAYDGFSPNEPTIV